eukprot:COSAG05_NODE_311_length_11636_cov_11.922250_5_plen_73_part_00
MLPQNCDNVISAVLTMNRSWRGLGGGALVDFLTNLKEPEVVERVPPFSETLEIGEIANECAPPPTTGSAGSL